MSMLDNILLLTDSYKVSHHLQYPAGTESIYSYFESRGGEFPEIVFFGLQYYLKKYLTGQVVTQEKIDFAEELFATHLNSPTIFNREGWLHILDQYDGRLPVSIKAVPEGNIVPTHNVMMTIENTDPKCYWLTNYLESLLVQVWYASTVATQSRSMKQTLLKYLSESGDPSLVDFKLHDFGFRGVSSVETAALGGAAHLINFRGTDTFAGVLTAREYYGEAMAGFSIPAAEHSTITSWGRENEVHAMENMLDQFPTGLVAVVSDSFDIYAACSNLWGEKLKDKIMGREGTLVIRPDSGDPPTVVVEILELLGDAFGVRLNHQGFKLLPPQVRVIQGDGIDRHMLVKILDAMLASGWSADNVAFGSGGGLLQKMNRDTSKYAFKCASAIVDGEARDVYKQPVTDNGKRSKAGRMKLVRKGDSFETLINDSQDPRPDELVEVVRNGSIMKEMSFAEIRERADVSLTCLSN